MPRVNKAGQGRKRVFASDLPVYDAIKDAVGATGIPLAAFDEARKNGCLFMRHGRVHLGEFIRWWFTRDIDDELDEDKEKRGTDWTSRDKRASALLRETKLANEKGKLCEFANVERFIRQVIAVEIFGELERISTEFPASLKGRSEVEIKSECDAQVEQIKNNAHKSIDNFIKKRGKL